MECSTPECGKPHFSRGLCQACFTRLKRNGTVQRKNVVNSGQCSVEGCDRKSFAKNLCSAHYQKAQHPLRLIWRLLRSRCKGDYPKGWDRFETFLADVGERPGEKHQLRRLDPTLPWAATNFVWREPIGISAASPEYARAWDLRKKYGMTVERLEEMRAEQDDRCAICAADFSEVKMCIDHDHRTGKVRGLLCDGCNKGLGAFDDDIAALERAAAYLEMFPNGCRASP